MKRTDPKKAIRSVRLFPRLATTSSGNQRPPRGSRLAVRTKMASSAAADANPALAARAEVRARLLRMILDNEQVRRNEQRPSPA